MSDDIERIARRQFIEDWRARQAAEAAEIAEGAGGNFHELDPRKLSGEFRERIEQTLTEHIDALAVRYASEPCAPLSLRREDVPSDPSNLKG